MSDFEGFRGGVCGCKISGGRLAHRYTKQSKALEDADEMARDAWVYACPSERRVWHVTINPIPGGQYVNNPKEEARR